MGSYSASLKAPPTKLDSTNQSDTLQYSSGAATNKLNLKSISVTEVLMTLLTGSNRKQSNRGSNLCLLSRKLKKSNLNSKWSSDDLTSFYKNCYKYNFRILTIIYIIKHEHGTCCHSSFTQEWAGTFWLAWQETFAIQLLRSLALSQEAFRGRTWVLAQQNSEASSQSEVLSEFKAGK